MSKYKVKITEKLTKVVEQEANSYEEAIDIVSNKYNDGKIILNLNNYDSVEYNRYPTPKILEDFNINLNYNSKRNELSFSDEYELLSIYECKNVQDFEIALNDFFNDCLELEEEQEYKKDKEYFYD